MDILGIHLTQVTPTSSVSERGGHGGHHLRRHARPPDDVVPGDVVRDQSEDRDQRPELAAGLGPAENIEPGRHTGDYPRTLAEFEARFELINMAERFGLTVGMKISCSFPQPARDSSRPLNPPACSDHRCAGNPCRQRRGRVPPRRRAGRSHPPPVGALAHAHEVGQACRAGARQFLHERGGYTARAGLDRAGGVTRRAGAQAEDGAAVDTPGTRRYPGRFWGGCCTVTAVRTFSEEIRSGSGSSPH